MEKNWGDTPSVTLRGFNFIETVYELFDNPSYLPIVGSMLVLSPTSPTSHAYANVILHVSTICKHTMRWVNVDLRVIVILNSDEKLMLSFAVIIPRVATRFDSFAAKWLLYRSPTRLSLLLSLPQY